MPILTILYMSDIGGILFIIGTYFFIFADEYPDLIVWGTWMFTIGSFLFFLPALYLFKLYFFTKKAGTN